MKFYNIRVRLGGSFFNEVNKLKLPAAEVHLLNAIHGPGSIVKVEEIGEKAKWGEKENRKLRAKLDGLYGREEHGRTRIERLFGISKTEPLPQTASMEDFIVTAEEVEADIAGGDTDIEFTDADLQPDPNLAKKRADKSAEPSKEPAKAPEPSKEPVTTSVLE